MALVKFGNGLWIPPKPRMTTAFGETSTTALTATGMQAAFIGRVWNKDGTTKTLTGVSFCFGAITKAGGSGLTVAQQGVSSTVGPPYQPDGTSAQTWAIANGNASFASNTWFDSGANVGQSVTFGQLISIVVGYDGSGRLGSDSVTLRGLTSAEPGPYATAGTVMFNNTSWALQSIVPNVILQFGDGTFGTLDGAWPHSAIAAQNVNSGSSPDEYGLEFTVSAPCKVDEIWAGLLPVLNSDFNLVLYSGTTALQTVSNDSNAIAVSGTAKFGWVPIPPTQLSIGTTYRITLAPTTTTNMSLQYLTLANAAHRQALPGFGESGAWVSRTGTGAFDATTTTRVPFMGLRVSHIDDGTGGGGGGRRPRMQKLGA